MSDGKVIIETDLDPSGLERGISKINTVASSGLRATTAVIAGVSTALMGAGGYAVKVGSDFEAGMSKVAAISGAAGSDLEALSNKAKEMGAKTKFSATEAASAFEYMAMAGWKTEDMLGGIEGIMNLAAASGEDLASVSDIVTDALTAFGLSASDSGHFADVLAKAASSSNTNVGLMGATFKYVAPIAGAMGYSVEDTATAIGLLANAGIKGEQAGTTLRAMLTRLVDPPKEAADAMEALGISVTNADGTMKPLNEVLKNLRQSFGGLDDSQKASYASALAGQEAMSGLLAIVGASDSDFNSLVSSINNADGAAQEMAETMQDNLQGQITILKSSAEGLGIAVYEHMEKPLRDAAKSGIEYVKQLSDAFKSGGFKGLVEEAGNIFAEITVKAAEQAPKMIDAGVSVIKSFISGIVKNKGKLYDSAVEITSTLANGLAELLPEALSRPAKKAIDGLTKSLKDGGLKEAGQTIADVFGDLIDVIGKIASVALPPLVSVLDLVGKHSDLLVISIEGLGAAFLTFKAAAKISDTLTKAATAFGAAKKAAEFYAIQIEAATYTCRMYDAELTVTQALVGLFTGELTAATAAEALMTGATTALNVAMAALPLVAVAGAVGAIVVAVESNKKKYEELGAATDLLTESEHKHIDAANESYESYQRMAETRQSSIDGTFAEYGAYEGLVTELQGITDENGNVKAGYEERAAVITGVLQEALGIEISTVDGVIQNYGELVGTLDLVIAKQKAQAVQAAYQEEISAAYKNSNEVLTKYNQLKETQAEKEAATAEAQRNYDEAFQAVQDHTLSSENVQQMYMDKLVEAEGALKSATNAQDKNAKAVQNAKSEFEGYQQTMQTYNQLTAALASGNADQIDSALARIQTSYKTAATATSEELTAQSMSFQTNLQSIQDGTVTATSETTVNIANMTASSLNELSQMSGGIPAALESLGPEASAAIISSLSQANMSGLLNEESKTALRNFVSGFEGLNSETQTAWMQAEFGALQGLDGFGKTMQDIGINSTQLFGSGISSQSENSRSAGQLNADAANSGAGSVNPTDTGNTFGGMFGAGVLATSGLLQASGLQIANSADGGAGSVNPTSTGNAFGSMLGSGVSAMSGLLQSSGQTIAGSADSGAGSINPNPTGSAFGSNFAGGISSTSGSAQGAGTTIATSAEGGADTADSYSVGSNFGSGFVSGIGAWISSAAQKAAELAAAAYDSAKSLLGIKSPSRKMRKVGKFFGQGFEQGIEGEQANVENAADKISQAALNQVDVSGIAEKIRNTVANSNFSLGNTISMTVHRKMVTEYEDKKGQQDHLVEQLSSRISVDIVRALKDAGLTVELYGKTVGKLIAADVDRELRPRKV